LIIIEINDKKNKRKKKLLSRFGILNPWATSTFAHRQPKPLRIINLNACASSS
jgi:hypothetical protein